MTPPSIDGRTLLVLDTSKTDRARWAAAVAAAGLVVAAALVVAPAAVGKSAPTVEQKLLSGMPLDGVTIPGTFDLSGKTLDQPFECTNCQIHDLRARNAIFDRPVDLAGSTFANADFTLATFGDLADFEGAGFKNATFVLARSRGDAIFAGPGSFEAPASFGRTSFAGQADFRNRTFVQPPDFGRATFSGRSDFGDSKFQTGGSFEGARFGTETAFLGATFGTAPCSRIGEPKKPACAMTVFDNVRSIGAIDFSSVKIPGTLVVSRVDVA